MTDVTENGYLGAQDPTSGSTRFNAIAFLFSQLLGVVGTVKPVEVVAVYGGGIGPVGMLDAQLLIDQVDGRGNVTKSGIVYGLPYIRMQGGTTGAVILDPKVGDIGIALICDRDISSLKRSKQEGPPASARRFSISDGIFLGGILGDTPTTYLQFDGAGNAALVVPDSNTISVSGGTVIAHANTVYEWDVNGYGQKITWTGSNNFTIDNYTEGTNVTTNNHNYDPPGPP